MIGIETLNRQPLNQAARKLLVKAKVKPDPDRLHALELAQWRLDQPDPNVKDLESVQDLVTDLALARPGQAMTFLVGQDSQEELVKDLEKQDSPKEAADRLLQQVASRGAEEVASWDSR